LFMKDLKKRDKRLFKQIDSSFIVCQRLEQTIEASQRMGKSQSN
jgi:hypothetical protein